MKKRVLGIEKNNFRDRKKSFRNRKKYKLIFDTLFGARLLNVKSKTTNKQTKFITETIHI